MTGLTSVTCYENGTLFLDSLGNVFGCGSNNDNHLPLSGNTQKFSSPTKSTILPPIKSIATGDRFSLFLDESGNVWKTSPGKNPEIVPDLDEIAAISMCYNHCLLLDTRGNVWEMGQSQRSRLVRSNDLQMQQRRIEVPPARFVAAGFDNSMIIDTQYNIWACGRNEDQQLVLPDQQLTLQKLPGMPDDVESIELNKSGSIFLRESGTVSVIGSNAYGKLGVGHFSKVRTLTSPTRIPNIAAVSKNYAMANHTFFVDTEGNCWGTGSDEHNQLGMGDRVLYRTSRSLSNPIKVEGLPRLLLSPILPIKSARNI